MPHGKFEFRGEGLSYLVLLIWTGLLTMITFGIFWPWGYCAKQKWLAKNTFIDGHALTFKGTGGGIFGQFLVVLLLSVVTVGIYAPWGYCRIKRWQVNNLYFADPGDNEA